MLLLEASFENYKALADVKIAFRPLTVLVGPNGCGKSTVLEGIADVLSLADWRAWRDHAGTNPFERRIPNAGALALRQSQPETRNDLSVRLLMEGSREVDDGSLDKVTLSYSISEAPNVGDYHVEVDLGALSVEGPTTVYFEPYRSGSRDPDALDDDQNFSEGLLSLVGEPSPRYVRLNLDPARIRQPSPGARSSSHTLGDDGAGLATAIALLASQRHPALDAIEAAVRNVVPQVRRLLPEPTEIVSDEIETLTIEGQPVKRVRSVRIPANTLKVEMASGAVLPISEVSEGTVLVLALLTVLYSPNAPQVVLLDDIDRALHPKAQAELVGCLRKILAEKPELQIVATSHSPYLLDLFEPDEVRVMALDSLGRAVCRNLAEAPDLPKLRQAYQTGEIWAHIWEDWALEGRDAK